MDLIYGTLYAVIAVISIAVYFAKSHFKYWKKRGILHDEPEFFYGNVRGVKISMPLREPLQRLYTKYKGSAPFCGMYYFFQPIALVLDMDLVKNVLVRDFDKFVDRPFYYNEKDDPLTAHLFALGGEKWRQLRSKLTPTFTSGKMKFMYPLVFEVGQRFVEVFGEMVGTGAVVDVKEILARFTTDVIGTCAFGIECNSLRDPNAEFRKIGQEVFRNPRNHFLVMACIRAWPRQARALGFRILPNYVHDFFMRAVRETVDYREKNGIVRNDFLNMLIELKNTKSIKTETGEVLTGLTMEQLAAQAFVFYFGGFESSSSTMGNLLYEIAQNQKIQDKIRKEVNDVFAKHNGQMNYESMKDMKYLDQAVNETLRMYTVLSALSREANEDYKVPGTNYTIEKGSIVFIPADAIHFDPEYYPNPHVFDPDRFSPDEVQKRDPLTWLAFGDGPRNCIGIRFGKMQIRIALCLLLKNFKFTVCEQTQIPMVFDPRAIVLTPKAGIYLRAEPIL